MHSTLRVVRMLFIGTSNRTESLPMLLLSPLLWQDKLLQHTWKMCKKVHRRGELWEYSSIATRRHSGQEKSQKLTKGSGPCVDSHPSCNTIREVIRPHFILQHDSEPKHATRVIKSCLQAQEKHKYLAKHGHTDTQIVIWLVWCNS